MMHSTGTRIYSILATASAVEPAILLRSHPQGIVEDELDLLVRTYRSTAYARAVEKSLRSNEKVIYLKRHRLATRLILIGVQDAGPLRLDIRGPILKHRRVFLYFNDVRKAGTHTRYGVTVPDPLVEAALLLRRNEMDGRELSAKHVAILNRAERPEDPSSVVHAGKARREEKVARHEGGRWRFRFLSRRVSWWIHQAVGKVLRTRNRRESSRIALHGVDGVGKSTAAAELAKLLTADGITTSVYHYFACQTILPDHQASRRNEEVGGSVSSGPYATRRLDAVMRAPCAAPLRLFFTGLFVMRSWPKLSGANSQISIHDRFIFDYVDKTLKKGWAWSPSEARFVARISAALAHTFVLVAEPEIVASRKGELSVEQIESLQESYHQLFPDERIVNCSEVNSRELARLLRERWQRGL